VAAEEDVKKVSGEHLLKRADKVAPAYRVNEMLAIPC
jgi:hypothetical protein